VKIAAEMHQMLKQAFGENRLGKAQTYNWYKTKQTKQRNKLRGLQSASELYRLIDRHLLTKFSANFCG
jgi:hypothetical protein